MNVIALLHFTSFLAYVLLIILVLTKRPGAILNRLCAVFIATFAIWSLFSGFVSLSHSEAYAALYDNISSIGWYFAPCASLWFFLALVEKNDVLKNKAIIVIPVLLSAFLIFEQWNGNIVSKYVSTDWGWASIWAESIYSYIYYAYFTVVAVICLYLVIDFRRKAGTVRRKKQAVLLIATGMSALATGVITDIFIRLLDIRVIPQVADILFMIMAIGLVYAISKYGLMSLTPVAASDEILRTMNESLILLDSKGKIVFANKSTLVLLNARAKDLQSESFSSIIGDITKADGLLEETRIVGSAVNRELLYQSSTGTATPVLASTAVVKDSSDSEVVGFVVSAMDITEHKRVEAEIKVQKELIDRILDCIPSAVLVLGRDTRIILANRAFYCNFAKTPLEVEGRPLLKVIPIKELIDHLSNAVPGSTSGMQLEFIFSLSGRSRIYIASVIPMQEELLLVLNDVTDERERQERLSLTDRMVSVGKMAAGIAHEVNNPLTSVIGLTQLLLGEDIKAQYKEDLQAIYTEALRASNVIKNLLTFARQHQPVRQAAKISSVVDDVLKLRSYEHRITNIQVDRKYDENVPDVTIDYFQMQQVFLNIILNAEAAMSEAHGKGQLIISTQRVNGHVIVSFKDDGTGIAKNDLKRIFDPFYTTKEVGQGTGLGLSICYGIVTNHGGRIYADSEPGKYTELVVELPINSGGNPSK